MTVIVTILFRQVFYYTSHLHTWPWLHANVLPNGCGQMYYYRDRYRYKAGVGLTVQLDQFLQFPPPLEYLHQMIIMDPVVSNGSGLCVDRSNS